MSRVGYYSYLANTRLLPSLVYNYTLSINIAMIIINTSNQSLP